jgi:flagellar motor switch protein FliM/N
VSVEFGPVHTLPPEELEAVSLLDLRLRVWAEIGRTQLPAASVVGMSEGAILDLDREPDEPADLYVNGRHFGTGRLILVDGEWALRVESLDEQGVESLDAGYEEDAPAATGAEPVEQSSNFDQDEQAPSD